MPNIHLQDPFGYNYQIVSSNPETIAAWLLEMFRKFNTENAQYMSITARIYPAYVEDPDTHQLVPDWPLNNQQWMFPPGEMLDKIIMILSQAKEQLSHGG